VAQTAPQTPADDGATSEVEEIVVTGSRIRRPQYEGTIPGAQVDRQAIEDRGFTNAIQILNDIPLVGPPVSAVSTGTAQPANLGAQYVDLLDIGSSRTLTLVNGRRMVSNNGGTIFVAGNEPGNQVDAGTIPAALIDRVDVLTVGGAAAYGSDAIAGVVNYILRDDFEGLDVRTPSASPPAETSWTISSTSPSRPTSPRLTRCTPRISTSWVETRACSPSPMACATPPILWA
jgi:outer membrane receptor protein involved in Fe transport